MQTLTRAAMLAAAAIAIVAAGGSAPARADGLPFCVENYTRTGPGRSCSFYTFQQCVDYTSGIGGTCAANPWYQPYDPAPRRHRARHYRD